MDNRILNKIAVHIEFTPKPSISLSANKMIKAFMINKKSPNVMIVIGSVRIIKIGLMKAFNRVNTTATNSAVVYGELKVTPGRSFANIIMATALIISLTSSFMRLFYYFKNTKYLANEINYSFKKINRIFGV